MTQDTGVFGASGLKRQSVILCDAMIMTRLECAPRLMQHACACRTRAPRLDARRGEARPGDAPRPVPSRHGRARQGMAGHGRARQGTARHGTARHGTARHVASSDHITITSHVMPCRTTTYASTIKSCQDNCLTEYHVYGADDPKGLHPKMHLSREG